MAVEGIAAVGEDRVAAEGIAAVEVVEVPVLAEAVEGITE